MSRSFRKAFYKIKLHWFQIYFNRKERRKAKRLISQGKFELAEGRLTRRKNYDVIDHVYNPFKHPEKESFNERLSRK